MHKIESKSADGLIVCLYVCFCVHSTANKTLLLAIRGIMCLGLPSGLSSVVRRPYVNIYFLFFSSRDISLLTGRISMKRAVNRKYPCEWVVA